MSTNKKVIGICTTFYDLNPSYSLASVVLDQLKVFVKNEYKTVLFVLPNFKDDTVVPEGVEIRKIVPQLLLEPYKGTQFPSHWKEDVEKTKIAFKEHMQDIDILICHDLFFIDTYLPYNIAIRESELKADILAWTHSAPSSRPLLVDNPHANRYTLPLKCKLVYLNHDKSNDLAEMYGAWLKDVRVVHNPRDPRTFWGLDPLVIKMIDKYDLFNADIISVYPLSTPRMISGKGLDKVIKIHSKLKLLGYKTKLIVCNAHANASPEQRMITETKAWASERGVFNDDLIFTSLEGKEYEQGVKGKIVSDLFRISNIFIFPTVSENSSLVLLEAMLSGNLLVLNKKVGTLLEHAGENALYMDFDYKEPQDVNENYYLDLAKIIGSQFKEQKTLQVKKRVLQKFNFDRVFKDEIEPLFYEHE
jgi:glycosyltransferase involved in cell wall biosynthesis